MMVQQGRLPPTWSIDREQPARSIVYRLLIPMIDRSPPSNDHCVLATFLLAHWVATTRRAKMRRETFAAKVGRQFKESSTLLCYRAPFLIVPSSHRVIGLYRYTFFWGSVATIIRERELRHPIFATIVGRVIDTTCAEKRHQTYIPCTTPSTKVTTCWSCLLYTSPSPRD